MHSDPPGSNCATAPDKVHKAASRREPHDDVKYDQQPPRQSRAIGLPEEGACASNAMVLSYVVCSTKMM